MKRIFETCFDICKEITGRALKSVMENIFVQIYIIFLHAFVKIYIWVSAAILYRQLIMYCSRNLDLNVPHLLLNQQFLFRIEASKGHCSSMSVQPNLKFIRMIYLNGKSCFHTSFGSPWGILKGSKIIFSIKI